MFKTMSARIRGSSTELAELGEEEDEFTKTTSKLQNLVKGLTGFDIMKDENTYKDIYDIILGIGKEWQNLTDIERASLTEALGGKRGVNSLSAVLDNVDKLEQAYETAEGAEGSAMREQENYAQSVQYSLDRAKASIQQLSVDFLSSDFLKGAIEAGNSFLQVIDEIINRIGVLPPLLATLGSFSLGKGLIDPEKGSLVTNLYKSFQSKGFEKAAYKSAYQGLLNSVNSTDFSDVINAVGNFSNVNEAGKALQELGIEGSRSVDILKQAFANLPESTYAAAAGISAVSTETTGLSGVAAAFSGMVSSPVFWGAAAITAVIAGIAIYQHHIAELQKQASSAVSEWESQQKQIESYSSSYEDLYKKMTASGNTDEETLAYKQQIYDLQQQIVAAYGDQAAGIDLVNGDLQTQLDLLEGIKNSTGKDNIVQNQQAYDEAERQMEGHHKSKYGYIGQLSGSADIGVGKEIAEIAKEFDDISFMQNGSELVFSIDANVNDAITDLDAFGAKLIELRDQYGDSPYEQEKIQGIIDAVANSQKSAMEISDKWGAAYRSQLYREAEKTGEGLVTRYSNAVDEYNKALATGDANAKDKAAKEYEEIEKKRQDFINDNGEKYGILFEDKKVDETAKSLSDFREVLGTIDDTSTKISESNAFSDQQRRQIKDFAKDVKEAGLDSVDLMSALDKAKQTNPHLSKMDQRIVNIAKSLGWAADNSQKSTNIMNSMMDALSGAGVFEIAPEVKEIDVASTVQGFMADIQKEISGLDNINAALVNNFSPTGLSVSWDAETNQIVGDVANLREAFSDLAGYDESKLFYRTATGVHANADELRKLRAEQEKITKEDFARKEEVLTTKLAEAYKKLDEARSGQDKASAMEQVANLQSQIKDMRDLESQYDAQTSAYQKWLNAQSAGEAGDIYDNILGTALTRGKELFDKDLVGTEEFRAISELMSGQDLSTATIDEVIAAYQSFDKQIEGSSHSMRDFFTEGAEGTDAFLDTLEEVGIDLNEIDLEEAAKRLGTSTSIIEALLGKAKDYGNSVQIVTKEQLAQLDLVDDKIEKAKENFEEANKTANKKLDGGMFDTKNLQTVDQIDDRISQVQSILKNPSDVGIDDSQAQALQTLLDALIEKKKILEGGGGEGESPTSLENLDASFGKLDSLKERIEALKEYQELGIDVDIEGDEQVQELATEIEELPPEIKTAMGIEWDADSKAIVQALMDGTLDRDFAQLRYEVKKANPFKQTAKSREQTERVQHEKVDISENTTKTNKITNETTNITNDIVGHQVEFTEVGAEEVMTWLHMIDEEAQKDYICQLVMEAMGHDDVTELSDAEQEVYDKTVEVVAEAVGKNDVDGLRSAIDSLKDKNVNTNVLTGGLAELRTAVTLQNQLQNKTVKHTTIIETLRTATNKTSNGYKTGSDVNGTAHVRGTAISRFGSAYARGNWGIDKKQTALMGELGPEIVVDPNTAHWHTVGDNGPEFVDVPRNAIVFNHRQTEDLLKHGRAIGRGKDINGSAFVGGSAFSDTTIARVERRNRNNNKSTTTTTPSPNTGDDKKKKKKTNNNNNNNSNNQTKKTNDPTLFDWIERLIANLNHQLEKFKTLGELYTRYTAQNTQLNNAITKANTLVKNNATAARKYKSQAKSRLMDYKYTNDNGTSQRLRLTSKEEKSINKLTGKKKKAKIKEYNKKGKYTKSQINQYASKVVNGEMKIQDIKDQNFSKAIQDYMDLIDKARECEIAVIENKIELRDLGRQKLDNIIDDYDNLVSLAQSFADISEENYNLLNNQKKGITSYQSNLNEQIKQQKKIQSERKDEAKRIKDEAVKQNLVTSYKDKKTKKTNYSWRTTDYLENQAVKKGYAKRNDDGTLKWNNTKKAKAFKENYSIYGEMATKAQTDYNNALKDSAAANSKLNDLYKQQRDIIKEIHESSAEMYEANAAYYSSSYDLQELEKGLLTNKGKVIQSYYTNLNDQIAEQNKALKERNNEANEYEKYIDKQIKNGKLIEGSEAWKEAKQNLAQIQESAKQSAINVENLYDKIRELNWASFNNAIEILGHLNTQLESTLSLFSDLNAFNEKGNVTTSGTAQYNLLAEQINVAKQETADYKYAIKQLGEEKKKGLITEEQYQKALRENQENMLKSANSVKKYRDSVLSLIKDGIQKETEHLKELIDTRKEALKRQKDADDYAKTVAQKSKDIQKTQAQIAAMAGDTTLATQAKVKQLREQLAQQEEELTQTRQDHAYDIYTQGLDDETTALEKAQKERITELESDLAEQNTAIEDALNKSQAQYETTYSFLSTIAKQYGIELEEDITNPWKKGSDAANEYKKAVSKIPKNNATIATDLNGGYTDKKGSSSSKKTTSTSKKSTAKKKNPTQQAKEKLNNARNALKNAQKTVLAKQDAFNSAKSKYGASSEQAKKANAAITTAQANLKTKTAAYNSAVSNAAKYGINTKESAKTVKNTAALERAEQLQKIANEQRKKANENLQTAQAKLEKSISSMEDLEDKISDLKATLKVAKSNNDSETVEATQKKLTAAQNSLTNAKAKINNATDGVNQAKQKVTNAAVSATNKKAAVNRATDNLAYSKEKDNQRAKTDAKNAINKGKARSKKLSAADKKLSALDQYIIQKYGRTPTNAIDKKIAKALGISTSTTMTAKQKTATLNAMKKLGLRSGAYRAGGGWRLTDEDGIGSEAILTKEGVLRQLDARDTVFNAKQRQALWDLSKMDVPSLLSDIKAASLARAGGDVRIENHYDSLLTVNGNVDRNALPELQEILRKSYEYTTKQMHSDFKKHIGGR